MTHRIGFVGSGAIAGGHEAPETCRSQGLRKNPGLTSRAKSSSASGTATRRLGTNRKVSGRRDEAGGGAAHEASLSTCG